jgi:hypothetical protein
VIVDQARIDWRTDGGQDIVTFTAFPDSIETLIADALRLAGLVPDEVVEVFRYGIEGGRAFHMLTGP